MTLQEVRDKINKLGVDMTAIMAKTREENNRALTSDEETRFDTMDTDRETLIKTERRLARVESLEGSTGRQTDPTQPGEQRSLTARGDKAKVTNLDRAEALRSWFLAGNPDHVRTAEQIDLARRSGIALDRKQITLQLAPAALRSIADEAVESWEKRYLGVDTISPDNGGHLTVPNETMRALEVALLAFGGMRQVASVIRTNTGAALPWPTMNDTSNEGAILGEAVQTTEVDPSIDSLTFDAYKYTSKKILVSVEFLQDSAINAADVIGKLLGERIARITNRHFTVGTGNGQPNGIVTAATASGVTTASTTAVTYDELVDFVHSVNSAYREQGGRFMFADTFLKLLKKIKVPQFSGDTAGYPLWRAGMSTKEPDTIDGYPYTVNDHMAAPTAGQKPAVFGALSKYQIRDVRDITLVRLDELYAEYGQVAFLAFSRHDGDLLDAGTHPVKSLLMHA
jgi:HK97 family phage major capsid protein